MGRAARLVKLYFEKNEVLPKRQCVTTTPPPLWFLLNETFQIEFLALAPRSRHSRPHTVSLPRQSDTGERPCAHDALQSPIVTHLPQRLGSAARAHPGAS